MIKNWLSILFMLFWTLLFLATKATAQSADRLIFNGDTMVLFSNPLEAYLSTKPQRSINNQEFEWVTTACYKGYFATWEIVNDSLFLISVQKGCQSETPQYFDLKSEFGSSRVFAYWFTGNSISPKGELLYYIHNAYESLYESEVHFKISQGKVNEINILDNSKFKQSDYSKNEEMLREFIYFSINWDVLPNDFFGNVTVYVQFSANENGVIDSAEVIKGYNSVFDNEAIRVIKSIPEWDVYYKYGKFRRIKWTLPIQFSLENKNKYKRE